MRGLILAALLTTGLAAASPQAVVGHSVKGRAIVAYERGDPSAPVTLVVGVIHGTEPAGLAVIRRLRKMPLPAGVHLWLVPTVNPDGLAAGTRQNAHGVDLNRNWPVGWKANGRPWDGYYSGPRPLSEPENRAMRAFILKIKPALTIWYHQPLDIVYGSDPHVALLKRYARLSGLPYKRLTAPPGAAHALGAEALSGRRALRGRVPGGPHLCRDRAPAREGSARARTARHVSSPGAERRRANPGRAGLDGPAGARRAAGARGGEAAPDPLLPLRLVVHLNERDGAPA